MRRALVALVVVVGSASLAAAQAPAGAEFQVNSYTTGDQGVPRASLSPLGRYIISWSGPLPFPTSGVWARQYLPWDAPFGGEFRMNTTDMAEGSDMAARHLDALVAVWRAPDGIRGQRYTPSWVPDGAEFRVNAYSTAPQISPAVAPLPGGGFVVAWSASSPTQPRDRVHVRRFDARGNPLGEELVANAPATQAVVHDPSVAAAADGRFVVVWQLTGLHFPFTPAPVRGRAFDAAGGATGPEFTVNQALLFDYARARVAMAADAAFVVVWQQDRAYPQAYGVRARMYTPAATPVGPELIVSESTLGHQLTPSVAAGALGDFIVAWSGDAAGSFDIVARRFTAGGVPRGGDFRVNTYTTGDQVRPDVASDQAGNFLVSWASTGQDGSGSGVFAQRFGGMLPVALEVDTVAGPSDGNGVLEPGETVDVRPWWANWTRTLQFPAGGLSAFSGPPGATYTIGDAAASYGVIPHLASGSCGDCYAVGMSDPAQRPQRHWDAEAREHLLPEAQGQRQPWTLHVGDTFGDVPRTSPFYRFVETLVHNRVTAGCAEADYCPFSPVTREQMAVFVVVARDRAGDPPPACGTPVFGDVPAGSPFCRWIEELARVGTVTGCGGGNYCPSAPVSREQMPVFVLKTQDPTLDPPACTTPMFSDVPADSPFCRWIEELARRGVVGGCAPGRYCPLDPVTREQMAVFITEGFGLRLYGP